MSSRGRGGTQQTKKSSTRSVNQDAMEEDPLEPKDPQFRLPTGPIAKAKLSKSTHAGSVKTLVKNIEKKAIEQRKATKTTRTSNETDSESSEFDFDEESGSESTDLSSSTTDSVSLPEVQLELALDPKTTEELIEKVHRKKTDTLKIKHTDPRGVIYLGHIPFGFWEPQIKQFFSQFGIVTRLRLKRNKKGRSREYAFVEFLDKVVADIVADTMDGYMMFGRLLVCKVCPPEQCVPGMFRPNPKVRDRASEHARRHNAAPIDRAKRIGQLLRKEDENRKRLKELGVDYDFPGFQASAQKLGIKVVSVKPTGEWVVSIPGK